MKTLEKKRGVTLLACAKPTYSPLKDADLMKIQALEKELDSLVLRMRFDHRRLF